MFRRAIAGLALLLPLCGCGYHAVGAATHLPASVRTIAVPTFTTRAQQFHTEFAFTQAVIHELDSRTRYNILPVSANAPVPEADAVLRGTILSEVASPLTYDSSSGETSSYLVTITVRVVLTDHNGRILYQNDALTYRGQYQSTQDISGFIQEDSAATRRIARDFAQTLVSNILESF